MVISVLHYRPPAVAVAVAVATRAIASAPGRDLSGIQFYPTQLQSANPTVKFYVSKATLQNRLLNGHIRCPTRVAAVALD